MQRTQEVSIQHLVVDSAGFIRFAPLVNIAVKVYTVQGVLDEIRDKNARHYVQTLPFELIIRNPTQESYKTVIKVSKETGDYASLTSTDLKVIALTHDLYLEHVGKDSICYDVKKPTPEIINAGKRASIETFVPVSKHDNYLPDVVDEEVAASAAAVLEAVAKLNVDDESQFFNKSEELSEVETNVAAGDTMAQGLNESYAADSDDSESSTVPRIDGFNEWIDDSNFVEVVERMESVIDLNTKKMEVACLTTDFSVQNVLLQMKMKICGINGFRIKSLRYFVLRCRVCAKTTSIVTKKFCPHCGHPGLYKAGISVDENGNTRIHINKQRAIVTRGCRFSIKNPVGGKFSNDVQVTEDHRVSKPKMAKCKEDPTSNAPFKMNDVSSRSACSGARNSYRKMPRNPNELQGGRKRGGKKR